MPKSKKKEKDITAILALALFEDYRKTNQAIEAMIPKTDRGVL